MRFYSVYDRKAGSYHVPQPFRHDADAIRAIQSVVNDGKSMLSVHAADFDFYYVGEFLEVDGVFFDGGHSKLFLVSLASLKEVSNG